MSSPELLGLFPTGTRRPKESEQKSETNTGASGVGKVFVTKTSIVYRVYYSIWHFKTFFGKKSDEF